MKRNEMPIFSPRSCTSRRALTAADHVGPWFAKFTDSGPNHVETSNRSQKRMFPVPSACLLDYCAMLGPLAGVKHRAIFRSCRPPTLLMPEMTVFLPRDGNSRRPAPTSAHVPVVRKRDGTG